MFNFQTFRIILDFITLCLCAYIFLVGIGRLASMGWWTHRRLWQVIYALLVIWAADNAFLVIKQKDYIAPVLGLIATSMWFHESRNRWRTKAPDYMKVDCSFEPFCWPTCFTRKKKGGTNGQS